MKKLLISLVLFGLGIAGTASATLYNYYQERGLNLPSVAERIDEAMACGIYDYRGTASQNEALEACLRGNVLGGSGGLPITDYSSTLTAPITSSATTIYVASIETTDGHTITTADISPAVYLVLDSNNNNKREIVKCTTVGTTYFSGCTRGLAFYGTTETAVTANQKSHSAGTDITLSNVHYYYTSPSVSNTWTAFQNFYGGANISSTTDSTTQQINFGTSTPSYFKNENGVLYYCNNGASCAAIGAGANTYLFNRPLYTDGSTVKQGTSTYDFVLDGSGNLSIRKNNSITSNVDGLGVATTSDYTWTGNHTFNGENTFNDQVTANATTTGFTLFGGQKALGDLTLTSGTTTFNTWATSTEWGNVTIDEGAALVFGSNFQNRVISMKVRGNLTLNGNIWAQGLGGLAGAQVEEETAGITGSEFPFMWTKMLATSTSAGSGGSTGGTGHSGGAGGGGGSSFTQGTAGATGGGGGEAGGNAGRQVLGYDYYYLTINPSKYIAITAGAGGGSGGGGQDDNVGRAGVGGAGGNGGGMLIIEVSGNITFGADSVIHAGGNNGSAGGNYVAVNKGGGGGGGGGGAGGTIVILYNGTYTNSGVDLVVSGGAGGAGGTGDGSNNGGVGGNGGNGYSIIEKNYSF